MYTKNELMFPPAVIPQLRDQRGPEWQKLVDRVLTLDEDDPEVLAFVLMMIRLDGCMECETDSYRAMRGCNNCATQTLRRLKTPDRDLLKLYVYGYVNQVRSSRRLEREAERNVEVIWLINRVTPAFKTIADFRKDHPQAIVSVCRAFTRFCREQSLFGAELLAIDGTKITAVASRKQVITPEQINKRDAAIERKIAEYLATMDEADRQEEAPEPAAVDVAAAIAALRAQRETLQRQAEELAREGLKQKVVGEPDAKLMRTPHGHQVAYNAQIAVDSEHKLIVETEMLEGFCENSQASRQRMSSTRSAVPVTVPVATLSRYVGTYDVSDGDSRRSCMSASTAVRGGTTRSSASRRATTAGAAGRSRGTPSPASMCSSHARPTPPATRSRTRSTGTPAGT